jgi:hypothetical protein
MIVPLSFFSKQKEEIKEQLSIISISDLEIIACDVQLLKTQLVIK